MAIQNESKVANIKTSHIFLFHATNMREVIKIQKH